MSEPRFDDRVWQREPGSTALAAVAWTVLTTLAAVTALTAALWLAR